MSKARVLAVDDQRYFRELIEGLLTEEGYQVRTVASGEEALRLLEEERFDVVLTDLAMPGMNGSELVQRVKERNSEQPVVVVTGVVDVKTAVDAMKVGANDYILKPFDRKTLARALDAVLDRKRLRDEHGRLVAENIEYMGELSLVERAIGLFSCLSIPPLAERMIEALCLETGTQTGVIWIAREQDSDRLSLAATRGLVRVEEEPDDVEFARLAADVPGLQSDAQSVVHPEATAADAPVESPALYIPLRHMGRVVAVARLTDKIEGASFSARDRTFAEKLAELGALAVANALRCQALERRSLRDPRTQAYTHAYFEDVLRHEIHKATRLGRYFSLLRFDLGSLAPLRRRMDEDALGRWRGAVVHHIGRALRATDLLAEESESRYSVLLPETDALGAASLKLRVCEALERSQVLAEIDQSARPEPHSAAATYPVDGTELDALHEALEQRLKEDRDSLVRSLGLGALSLPDAIGRLLEHSEPERIESVEQIARFVFEEVGRHPRERGLLFVAPVDGMESAVQNGLRQLRGAAIQTEIVVVTGGKEQPVEGLPITWVSPERVGVGASFLIYYGQGLAYALVCEAKDRGEGPGLFHTSDRVLVEHLAFRLQRELKIPLGT